MTGPTGRWCRSSERIVLRIEVHLGHRSPIVGIEDRNIRLTLRVEIQRSGIAEDTHSVLDGRVEDLPHRLLVFKLNLRLGRMDVDVDIFWRDIEIEEEGHLFALRYQPVKSRHHRLGKIRMAHIAAIDKEILMGILFLCRLRLAHKAMDATERGLHLHGQEVLVETVAKDIDDALAQATGPQVEQFRVVAVQTEDDLGIDQHDTLECRQNVVELGIVGLEKLAARGDIEEEVLHHEVGAFGTCTRLLPCHLTTGDGQMRADVFALLPRLQFHLRYGSDRRQSFATEPHGMEVEEVVGLADLRRGMSLKGQSCVGLGHALTVVNDLNGRAPGIDYSDVDVLGAGVDSILYEFLDDRGGALDNLTGRDLVGY